MYFSNKAFVVSGHPSNDSGETSFNPSGTLILVRLAHPLKALFPIIDTVFGSITFFKLLQFQKVVSLISVIPSDIMISLMLLQASNAQLPISLIPSPIFIIYFF